MEYYNRIFQKKSHESDSDFEHRITVIKNQLPQLPVWKNELYKNYVTTVESTDTDSESQSDIIVTTTTTTTSKKRSPSRKTPDKTDVSYSNQL